MKLSDLVAYRNLLNEHFDINSRDVVNQTMTPVQHIIETHDIQFPELLQELKQSRTAVLDEINNFTDGLKNIRDEIERMIGTIEPTYLSNSYRLYEKEMVNDSSEKILERRPNLDDGTKAYLLGRIRLHSDWRHAGMIIRPGLEDWITDLVALDPLYLVDQRYDLLTNSIEKFNVEYQRRLRPYVIRESSDYPMMNELPNGQFSFCLAYNFFNFKPFEIVRGYLHEIYDKLAPGGVLGMTFNDCDRKGAVINAERNYMCYTPGSMVRGVAQSMGYIVVQTYHIDAASTWMELRKPGQIQSFKGGQTLARINHRPDPKVDNPQ